MGSGSESQVTLPLDIPEKLYFKIGEVARITGLKPYVLRYWETEFPTIRPTKSKTNQRVYQRRDIETILLIKKLLYDEKFTIEGARARIKELRASREPERSEPVIQPPSPAIDAENLNAFLGLRDRLRAIGEVLDRDIGA